MTFSTFNHLHLINFCHLGNKLFIYHTRPNQFIKKLLSSLMQFDEGIFKGQNFCFVFFLILSSSFYSCIFLRISIKNIRILFMDSENKNFHSVSSLQGVSKQEVCIDVNNECWIRKIIFFSITFAFEFWHFSGLDVLRVRYLRWAPNVLSDLNRTWNGCTF